MPRFRATIRGNRGEASRLGSAKSGIKAEVNGWDLGVDVFARDEDGEDELHVYMTSGSNGRTHERHVGTVRLVDGVPTWEPV